jgi:hypothetical protein
MFLDLDRFTCWLGNSFSAQVAPRFVEFAGDNGVEITDIGLPIGPESHEDACCSLLFSPFLFLNSCTGCYCNEFFAVVVPVLAGTYFQLPEIMN